MRPRKKEREEKFIAICNVNPQISELDDPTAQNEILLSHLCDDEDHSYN